MATASATQAATWQLDPAHSSVEFSVKHMMMTTVRGRFKEMSATLTADEEHPEGCCRDSRYNLGPARFERATACSGGCRISGAKR